MRYITVEEIEQKQKGDYTLIDVRTPEDYQKATFLDAVNIPLDGFLDHVGEIPKEKPV